MAAKSFFTRVTNDVLEASEKISARLEEGLSVLMTGGLPQQQEGKDTSGGGGGAGGSGGQQSSMGDDGGGDDFEIMEEEAEMRHGSPLEGIAENVIGDIMKGQAAGPQTPYEHFQAFRHAITWNEPFIMSLVAFQIMMLVVCIVVSRRNVALAPRLVVMVCIGIIVRSAETINQYAAMNWESFSTQNYFDERGVFISIMLCGPLLLDSFIMLSLFVKEAGQLLIQVKKTELSKKKKKEGATTAKKEGTGSSDSGNKEKKRRAKKEQ